ncbi:MAG: DUF1501 domain-containing protein [Saprospiraceae bacterium]|nr:DUF1501 domain-containing protein [Saprospiraceae bacterium]MDW8484687.1 DUF1501 domain-containing protein [Saprospiraceae bacterium]
MKRREFLKIVPAAGISSFLLNGFAIRPFANSRLARLLSSCEDIQERTLVLIQLKGGNDGLNNLVPLAQYSRYRALRPTTGLAESGLIELDSTLEDQKRIGLHPAMQALKELYDRGWVSIVQGVGYPNPNQSHFKSTDLWLTGGDGTPANYNISSGWMGRSLQALFPDVAGAPTPTMPDPLGIQVGDTNPSLGFHTETEHQNAINLSGQDPAGFYSLVQTIGGAPVLDLPDSEHGEELAYIMSVERSVNQYAKRITEVFNAGTNIGSYPNTALANQLKTVARLIRGGIKTKIFLCSIGGFDTHNAQVDSGDTTKGVHANLLRTLSEAIKAFMDDLNKMSIAHRAIVCTFSEFGRCAAENGSFGTDHGTLAPMYIVGKGVNPGVSGTNVNLSDLTNDNQLKGTQHDYRQVFATLLQDWLGANDWVLSQAFFTPYPKVSLISPAFIVSPHCYYGGSTTSVEDLEYREDKMLLYPNPACTSTEVFLRSTTAYEGVLSVHSIGGSLVHYQRVLVEPGDNAFLVDVLRLSPGTYLVRLKNTLTGATKVAKMSVMR